MKCRSCFCKVLRLFHFPVILIDSVELQNVVLKTVSAGNDTFIMTYLKCSLIYNKREKNAETNDKFKK